MAAPVIHYTFDVDGTNSGSLGSAHDLTIPSDFSIDDTNQLIGTKCLKAIGPSTASSATTITTFPAWTTPDNFTISLWGKCSAWTSTNHRLIDFTINGILVVIAFQTNQSMLFFNSLNNALGNIIIPNTFDNAYHHFVLTFSGTTADLYIDNVLYTPQVSFPFSFSQQSITALAIGSALAADPTYNGYIDDFRIYDYALPAAQINSLYIEGLIINAPIIHYPLDVDGTNNGSLGTTNDLTIPVSLTLDSNALIGSKCLSIPTGILTASDLTSTATWTTPATGMLISFWVKAGAWQNSHTILLYMSVDGKAFQLYYSTNNNRMALYGYNSGGGGVSSIDDDDIYNIHGDDTWHHVVLTFVGTSVRLYWDNAITNLGIASGDYTNKSVTDMQLGAVTGQRGIGLIDDFRVYEYTTNETIIDTIYKLGKNTNVVSLSGAPVSTLQNAGATLVQMITTGVTIEQLLAGGFSVAQLLAANVTATQLVAGGVTVAEILAEGIIPDWALDTDANHLAQSYVKDFIDISGSLALRENASLTVNGNIETKGNVTIKNPIMAADLSLNHNIFVVGDISMNGNVTVGDVSMNGKVVDCSFTDSSIPESAINGTYGPDYTQPTIVYEKGFDTTMDISMNANVQINNLKVDGKIEFSDGTTMNTFDDNKFYLAPAMSVTSFTNPIQSTTINNSTYSDQVITVSSDGKYVMIEHGNLADDPSKNNYYLDNTSGNSGIALSTDYGSTFTRVEFKHPDTGAILVNYNFSGAGSAMSYTGQHIITGISGSTETTFTDAMIGLSADYGTTWTTKKILDLNGISGDYTNGYVGNVGIKHDGTTMAITIFGNAGNNTYISTDYGETWTFLTNIFTTLYSLRIMNDHFIGRGNEGKSLYIIDSSSTLLYTHPLNLYQNMAGRAQVSIPLKGNRIVIGDSGNGYYRITYDPNTSTYSSGLTNASWKTNSTISPSGQYIAIGMKTYVSSFKNGFDYSPIYFSNDYGETFAYLANLSYSITGDYNTWNTSNAITDNGTWYACMGDNRMYRINLQVRFKPSTFTSLTISNTLTAGTFSTSSDYRIKTDVSQLDETITLDNLRPVKYLQTLINKLQYGFIAHELQEYYPDLVVGEKDGEEWQRVNYTGLIALLINEIKQLKRDLVELENGM